MARTPFEATQAFLKLHPDARYITPRCRTTKQEPPRRPNPERHSRKCHICKHPDRDLIELDFIRWRSTAEIAQTYGIADHSSICRHARGTGLDLRRRQTVGFALEPILEQSEAIVMKATVGSLISAVRAYSQINDEGGRVRRPPDVHVYNLCEEDYKRFQTTGQLPRFPRSSNALAAPFATRRISNRAASQAFAPHVPESRDASPAPLATGPCTSPAADALLDALAPNRPIQELEGDPTH